MNPVLKAVVLVAIPLAVLLAGGKAMRALAGGDPSASGTPLNMRWKGYDAEGVMNHWQSMGTSGVSAEQRLLEIDLAFPLVYGAAFACTLLLAWAALGRPFDPAWLVAGIGLTIVADWTENLVLWSQLAHFVEGGSLREGWIRVASAATQAKIVLFSGLWLLLAGLAIASVRSAK